MELDNLNVKFLWMNSPDKFEEGYEIGENFFLPGNKIYHNSCGSIGTRIYKLTHKRG